MGSLRMLLLGLRIHVLLADCSMLQHIQNGQEDGTWSEEESSQAEFILAKVCTCHNLAAASHISLKVVMWLATCRESHHGDSEMQAVQQVNHQQILILKWCLMHCIQGVLQAAKPIAWSKANQYDLSITRNSHIAKSPHHFVLHVKKRVQHSWLYTPAKTCRCISRAVYVQVTELEGRLLGRGVFQRFLDTYMGPTSSARRACCSAEFVTAAASIAK